jgi:hypothetical protein
VKEKRRRQNWSDEKKENMKTKRKKLYQEEES